jgi:hypothetical protein
MKKRLTLDQKAVLAMKSAIRKLIERHKKTGLPLIVWENGKVARISPDSL